MGNADPRLIEHAESLLAGGPAQELLGRIASDPEFERRADEDAAGLFREYGLEIPDELEVRLLKRRRTTTFKPAPDFMAFAIELTNCRTFWVSDEPGEPPHLETVCFGIQVTQRGASPVG